MRACSRNNHYIYIIWREVLLLHLMPFAIQIVHEFDFKLPFARTNSKDVTLYGRKRLFDSYELTNSYVFSTNSMIELIPWKIILRRTQFNFRWNAWDRNNFPSLHFSFHTQYNGVHICNWVGLTIHNETITFSFAESTIMNMLRFLCVGTLSESYQKLSCMISFHRNTIISHSFSFRIAFPRYLPRRILFRIHNSQFSFSISVHFIFFFLLILIFLRRLLRILQIKICEKTQQRWIECVHKVHSQGTYTEASNGITMKKKGK